MIQFGKDITKVKDPLQNIPLQRLFKGIQSPKQAFKDQIERLRTIASIDPSQYKILKKQLPYFVCGIFYPAIRRKTHFAHIQLYMIDLDHLAVNDIDQIVLLQCLKADARVVMAFRSPSNDGFKILFRLSERCSDEALFVAFYKLFATQFAAQYGLNSVIDYRVSDVTRACFMSYDDKAYFNADAVPVMIKDYLPQLDFDESEQLIKQANKIISSTSKEEVHESFTPAIFKAIRNKLQPKTNKVDPNPIYVPPQIHEALATLKTTLKQYDLELLDATSIHYGKKLKIGVALYWCEINLFFGKKGYSIVKTTKTGSNAQLADIAYAAIEEILFDYTA